MLIVADPITKGIDPPCFAHKQYLCPSGSATTWIYFIHHLDGSKNHRTGIYSDVEAIVAWPLTLFFKCSCRAGVLCRDWCAVLVCHRCHISRLHGVHTRQSKNSYRRACNNSRFAVDLGIQVYLIEQWQFHTGFEALVLGQCQSVRDDQWKTREMSGVWTAYSNGYLS